MVWPWKREPMITPGQKRMPTTGPGVPLSGHWRQNPPPVPGQRIVNARMQFVPAPRPADAGRIKPPPPARRDQERIEGIRAWVASQHLARNEFETLLDDLNRKHDNLARRARYRKTMRGRHLPVR